MLMGDRSGGAPSPGLTAGERAEELLRQSEERWRTLLAHMQEMVMLVDGDGCLSYVSPSVRQWLGYGQEELIGRGLADLAHEEDTSQVLEALSGGDPQGPRSLRHRVRARDGAWHWLDSTFVWLQDDPAVAGVMVTARDVTDAVEFERERERLELDRRVSQRLEAVGQLAAGIAHEINTPLQFVGDSMNFLIEPSTSSSSSPASTAKRCSWIGR